MSENNNNNMQELTEQDINEIIRVRREKLKELVESGKNPFEIVRFEKTHGSRQIISGFEALEGKDVSVAGRIITRRLMGKASFCHILDGEGMI